jgi:hypothetical protein
MRSCSAWGISSGIRASGRAKGLSSGFIAARPAAWSATFSSRNLGGMSPSAIPSLILAMVSSSCRGRFRTRVR